MTVRPTVLAAIMACATALPSFAQELKFASFTPPFHTVTPSLIDKLAEDVADATDGALTVRAFHGGELGAGPVEQYVRVVQGAADIAWGLPGYTSSQFPRAMIVELPGALPADMGGYDMLWNAYDDYLQGEFPGTVPVALWASEPAIIIMREKIVRSPADLEGLKIRVAGATAAEVAKALGATPVQMPINQVYNALQTGLIDGVITGSSAIADFKLDEVANAYTIGAPLGRLSFFAVMNRGVYEGLSDEARTALDAAIGRELSKSAEDAWNAKGESGVAAARLLAENTFVDLTEAEAAAFAAVTLPVTDAYLATVDAGADVLARMQAK